MAYLALFLAFGTAFLWIAYKSNVAASLWGQRADDILAVAVGIGVLATFLVFIGWTLANS